MRIKEAEGNLNIVVVYNEKSGKEKEIEDAITKVTEEYEGEGIIVGGF